MNELIKLHDHKGQQVVSARDLHLYLESKQDFSDWIKARIVKYEFAEGQDYTTFHKVMERNGERGSSTRIEYALTLDMAKELSMVEGTDRGREVRHYFIECEKKLRAVANSARPAMPTTYSEALRQLLSEVEKKEALEQELLIAAPKLAFVQAIEVASNSLSFAKAAQWLKLPGVGRNNLINMLRRDGILQADRSPYQQYVEAGYFEVEPQTYKPGPTAEKGQKGIRLAGTTRVTGKGLEWLARKYKLTPPVTSPLPLAA